MISNQQILLLLVIILQMDILLLLLMLQLQPLDPVLNIQQKEVTVLLLHRCLLVKLLMQGIVGLLYLQIMHYVI
ncbi:hypothetical protein C5O22_03610 [Treponema sp. J25]|nr:hypothetical protein C5O22_03610 [Treponema sp. J25]